MCGRPSCACAQDPAARHGPYFEWWHMRTGKLVHRQVSAQHAAVLRRAIINDRMVSDWAPDPGRPLPKFNRPRRVPNEAQRRSDSSLSIGARHTPTRRLSDRSRAASTAGQISCSDELFERPLGKHLPRPLCVDSQDRFGSRTSAIPLCGPGPTGNRRCPTADWRKRHQIRTEIWLGRPARHDRKRCGCRQRNRVRLPSALRRPLAGRGFERVLPQNQM